MRWSLCRNKAIAFILSSNSRKLENNWNWRHIPLSPASSVAIRGFSSDEASAEDLSRWERLYQAGREPSVPDTEFFLDSVDMENTDVSSGPSTRSQVRVITFDLDNTLWKTSATIDAANSALAAFLDEKGIVQTRRTEQVMGDLFASDKVKYCPEDPDNSKGPVLLTLLRKDAIQSILVQENEYTMEKAVALAEEAFAVWVEARHAAIESNLAADVAETMKLLSSIKSSTGTQVKIGAVTDGNSNPDLVDCLAGIFDFVVNAEQVGVAKPDKRIYLQAFREILLDEEFHKVMGLEFESAHSDSVTDGALEDVIGPWWVHVGDDFVKDIVAAKSLNMRSIWVKELVHGKVQKVDTSSLERSQEPQRTVEDLVKEVSSMKVVEMEIGAEDFLAQSLQSEFADAVVDRFADLAEVIVEWHGESETEYPAS